MNKLAILLVLTVSFLLPSFSKDQEVITKGIEGIFPGIWVKIGERVDPSEPEFECFVFDGSGRVGHIFVLVLSEERSYNHEWLGYKLISESRIKIGSTEYEFQLEQLGSHEKNNKERWSLTLVEISTAGQPQKKTVFRNREVKKRIHPKQIKTNTDRKETDISEVPTEGELQKDELQRASEGQPDASR